MRYQGSKRRVAKHIWPAILEDLGQEPTRVIEPFIGGANFTSGIIGLGYTGSIVAGDLDPDCNFMWQKVLEGWLPTLEQELTKEEFAELKAAEVSDNPLRGFARVSCTFGAQPWGNWTDTKTWGQWRGCVNSLTKQQKILQSGDVKITGGSYDNYEQYVVDGTIFYFDPPYANTKSYNRGIFDTPAMWSYAEKLSEKYPVFVSELNAPVGWKSIADISLAHGANSADRKTVTEKLFRKF